MLKWTAIFFVIALVSALLGFGGVATFATSIAKLLFFAFLVLALLTGITSLVRSGKGSSLLGAVLTLGLPLAATTACVPPQNIPVTDSLADLDDRVRPQVTSIERTVTDDDGDPVQSSMVLTWGEEGCIERLEHEIDGEPARDITFTCDGLDVVEAEAIILDGDPIHLVYERDDTGNLTRAQGTADDGETLFDARFDYAAADVVAAYEADVELGSLEYELDLAYTYDDRDLVSRVEGSSESELGWWVFGVREERDLKLELAYDDVWRIADVTQTLDDPSEPGVIETAFAYDDAGRVVAASSTDGEETTISYDDAGRVTRVDSSNGDRSVTTVYRYGDALVGGLVLTPDMRHGRFFDLQGQSHGRMEAELDVLALPALNDLVLAR